MGEYFPEASSNEGAAERNQNLPGLGGLYNSRNLQTYHYAGNNPLKYTDPTGEMSTGLVIAIIILDILIPDPSDLGVVVKFGVYVWLLTADENEEGTTPENPTPVQTTTEEPSKGQNNNNQDDNNDEEDVENRNGPPRYDSDKDPSTPVGRVGERKVKWEISNAPRKINSRQYSGHAIDRMQQRGLTPRVIEDTIQNGVAVQNSNGTTTYSNNGVSVVTNENGDVVTVMIYSKPKTTPEP